jgi:hypothetical protein
MLYGGNELLIVTASTEPLHEQTCLPLPAGDDSSLSRS